MGTRTDCFRLTLRPETQAHCRWGSPNLSLTHDDSAMPPVDVMLHGGPNQPVVRTATESVVYRPKEEAAAYYLERKKAYDSVTKRIDDPDFYTPPATNNSFLNPTEPTGTLVKGRGLELRFGIWGEPTGFSTYTNSPVSVDMELWKNGGTPFPPRVEYMMVLSGLRFRSPIL